ncbi:hypothetical protein MM817_03266 [Acidibacillus sp. S0AB]|uniref:Uncharacterized protein n=1 Tax=Sulfoacidibacillus ferrooxidans TaxID=2005001 RepID=A0A9X1VCR1_9BACL|nr:hypothetical protein [Sulfoacidibacillus ferrooxidans]MCI0184969.1 hypothetical protein [Sulfoacidibacillus ferrooxidans]
MDIFQIEEREFEDLMSFTRGQGRWSVGEEVFYNQFTTADFEFRLFNTRFVVSEAQLLRQVS